MKSFFYSCLGVIFALILFFVVIVAVMVAAFRPEDEPVIERNTVLHLKMEGTLVERTEDNPLEKLIESGIFGDDMRQTRMGLLKLKKAIEKAKKDSRIEGIYIDIKEFRAGSVLTEELRQALMDFKTSEKWVVAHGTYLSMGNYYLASAADAIYLHPEGGVEFNGMAVRAIFLKKMFDKLKIKPEVFRVGDYKGAAEPFMRENLSEENRTQITELLQDIEESIMSKIAEARKTPLAKLKVIADSAKVRTPHDARVYGLVDGVAYKDQLKSHLRNRMFGLEGEEEGKEVRMVKYTSYIKGDESPDAESENKIAVVVVEGEIAPGKSNAGKNVAGALSIIKAVKKARRAEEVVAIVMRINSPGGSFIASDDMWREIKLAAGKKPVIASMSNYAASGGYYLAAACDTIVAQPTTITGSIGVFGVFFDAHEFLEDKIGITSEEVKTGQLGNITPMAAMSPLAKAIWQSRVDSIYQTFVGKVAAGRKMSEDDVRAVASGRVWSGKQAKENGLVDRLGNYKDALEIAAKKADVTDYTVRYYPEKKDKLEEILSRLKESARLRTEQNRLGAWYPLYRQWEKIKLYEGVQARMPFDLADKNAAAFAPQ